MIIFDNDKEIYVLYSYQTYVIFSLIYFCFILTHIYFIVWSRPNIKKFSFIEIMKKNKKTRYSW